MRLGLFNVLIRLHRAVWRNCALLQRESESYAYDS
jgi:hypothetical protein